MKYDVITFGSAILDAFVKSPEVKVIDFPKFDTGKALAAPYGSKCEVDELVITSGGGGTNTAVGLARLGLKTAVVGRCGWDLAGKFVRQEIKKEGVDDSLLVQFESETTDYSTILIGPDGGRTILVYRGGTRLQRSVIDFKKLNAFWFCTSSLEGNLDLWSDLIDHAKKNHIKIASNPGRREIAEKKKLIKVAQNLDVLIVNRAEAAKLTGFLVNDDRVFGKIFSAFPKVTVVVTEGVNGAHVSVPQKGRLKIEGLKVKAVDSTGAGDGFTSGLVAGLAKGWDLEKSLRLGVANGAAAVTKIGAKTSLIRQKEIGAWLKKPLKITKTPSR